MKKIVTAAIMAAMLAAAGTAGAYTVDERDVKVLLDGNPIEFDVPAQLIDGRTMVPVRAIFEALGAEVTYEEETETAVGKKGDTEVRITVNENALYKNGEKVEIDVPAMEIDWRILVPARAISQSFDADVDWDDATSTVYITTKSEEAKGNGAELEASAFAVGNGFAAKGRDAGELSADDRLVSVNKTEDGITVSHGGYYTNGKDWGGVAVKDAHKLDGMSVTIRFDEVPEINSSTDCWFSLCFLQKPQLFQVGDVAGNKGFMNLVRFASNKWEIYEGKNAFSGKETMMSVGENTFTLKKGDVITISAKLVDGNYQFTYTKGDDVVIVNYRDADFTKVFEDGKAHFVISASCDNTSKDAFKYTITDLTYAD